MPGKFAEPDEGRFWSKMTPPPQKCSGSGSAIFAEIVKGFFNSSFGKNHVRWRGGYGVGIAKLSKKGKTKSVRISQGVLNGVA